MAYSDVHYCSAFVNNPIKLWGDGVNKGDDDEQGDGEGGASEADNGSVGTNTDVDEDGESSDGNADDDGDDSPKSKALQQRDYEWMTTTPYDESIHYSHRYGYTWAGTTSSEWMAMWQINRKNSYTSEA
ncbi:hypothetical protein MMC29_005300 [Sticta canariensis]|nr:hypothetical protein [Sticta canariensis]